MDVSAKQKLNNSWGSCLSMGNCNYLRVETPN